MGQRALAAVVPVAVLPELQLYRVGCDVVWWCGLCGRVGATGSSRADVLQEVSREQSSSTETGRQAGRWHALLCWQNNQLTLDPGQVGVDVETGVDDRALVLVEVRDVLKLAVLVPVGVGGGNGGISTRPLEPSPPRFLSLLKQRTPPNTHNSATPHLASYFCPLMLVTLPEMMTAPP